MKPRIVDPTPVENAAARQLTRVALDAAVNAVAEQLRDQPLSIKQLMARLLIEDFAALDPAATTLWLDANVIENRAKTDDDVQHAHAIRARAFDALAHAEMEANAPRSLMRDP